MEYASTVAHPVYKKDEDKLEGAQRRASRILPGYKELSYRERLRALQLPTLKYRRKRADMLQVWRIIHRKDDLDESNFFQRKEESRTRGHPLKLSKTHNRTKIRSQVFSQRIVNMWNALPESVVCAPTLNSCKSRLEKWWKDDPERYSYATDTSQTQTSHSRLLAFDREGH